MKNSKKFLVIVFAIVSSIFWSCDKTLSDNQIIPQQTSVVTSGINIKNNNGVLEFNNFEDYNYILYYTSQRKDNQKSAWNDSLQFKSYGFLSTGAYDRDSPYGITSWTINAKKQVVISGDLWEIHEDFIAKINSDGTQTRFGTNPDSEKRGNYLKGTGDSIDILNLTNDDLKRANALRYVANEIRSPIIASANAITGCAVSYSSVSSDVHYTTCVSHGTIRWFDWSFNFSKNVLGTTITGKVKVNNYQASCSHPYPMASSTATTITASGYYRTDASSSNIPFYTSGSNVVGINNNIFSVSAGSICALQVVVTVVKDGMSTTTSGGL